MTEPEVDALDRDLDLLALVGSVSTDGPDRPDVLGLLAMVRAVDWPDRAAGKRVAGAVASKLAVQSVVPAAVSHAHPNGTSEPGAEVTQTVDWWSRMTAEPGGRDRVDSRRRHSGHRRVTVRRLVALSSAVALVLVGVITGVTALHGGTATPGSAAGPAQVYHSRFTATVLTGQSQTAGTDRKLAGGWQLLSYVSTPDWHANYVGTPPLSLSCPTVTVCYMIAARPVPASGTNLPGPQFNLLEVSRDGGASWTTLSLPSDVSITTPLQCPKAVTTCYAAGYDAGRVVLLTTADGGLSWTARTIPGSLTGAATLACVSDGSCVGLFEASGWAPGYNLRAPDAKVLVTRDGGLTWSAGPPTPHGQLPDYLACSGTTCVLFDQLITLDNTQSVNGSGPLTVAPGTWVAWYSHDGGATWQRGRHPVAIWTMASHDLPEMGTISCSDHMHCWAAMSSQQIGNPGIATAFVATSDGGATWVTQPLPTDRARQFIPQGMSCPTAMECYAAGSDSVGPVILTTRDGGAIWSPVNLPRRSAGSAQNGSMPTAIGLIACSAAGHCVAAPQNNDSAHRVPIYSLGSG
jgi:photosystem II stability/assembly factor-like uncharacterized protein